MYKLCKYVALGRTYESAPTHVVYAAVLQHFFNSPMLALPYNSMKYFVNNPILCST